MSARRPFRTPTLGPRAARGLWLSALATARTHAQAVVADEPTHRFAQAEFARAMVQLEPAPFPLAHASARAMAGAFLAVGRALTAAVRPVDRQGLAAVALACVAAMEAQLDQDRLDQAEAWKRQIPERDR